MAADFYATATIDIAGLPLTMLSGAVAVAVENNEAKIKLGAGGTDHAALEVHVTHLPALIEQLAHAYRLAVTPDMVAA